MRNDTSGKNATGIFLSRRQFVAGALVTAAARSRAVSLHQRHRGRNPLFAAAGQPLDDGRRRRYNSVVLYVLSGENRSHPGLGRTEEEEEGANWIRPGSLKCRWRVVVGQRATLKADQKT